LLNVVESYVRYYASGDGHTARAKRYDLEHFLKFLAGPGGLPELLRVGDWTMQKTADFVDRRINIGEAPSTVSRRLATIKHLGRTLAERVPGFINPAREVKGPAISMTKPKGLSRSEVELLLQAADEHCLRNNNSFASRRNRFLLLLLLRTGLRADEARLLVASQLSEDGAWLKNVKTKGKKFRNVYLDSFVQDELAHYMLEREAEIRAKTPGYFQLNSSERGRFPVFVSGYRASVLRPESFGLSSKSVWRIISDFGYLAKQCSKDPTVNLHPHKLRHTFAHGLLDSSKDVRLVAQALGHSDVRTTMRYTERTEEEVAAAIERKAASGK
jgi:integrase/recombinase XerD